MSTHNDNRVISAVSTGASITGATGVVPLYIAGLRTGSFQIEWTGSTQGEWFFLVSNRRDAVSAAGVPDLTKFTALANPSSFSALQPAGTADSKAFTFADLSALWILPKFVRASGTGVASAWGCFC